MQNSFNKNDTLIINSIDYTGSIVDGPGIRTVLYVQGCQSLCNGCHNPSTWDISKGKKVLISNLVQELRSKVTNKKLTISGGEPLLQKEAILNLIKQLPDFNIVLYTGFELNEVSEDILRHLDYIKVGKYIAENRTTTTPYIGSSNQKFIKIK